MAGDRPAIRRWQRATLARLVHRFETRTGLQLVLYVGPTEDDPAAHAEQLLGEASPDVLLLVAPERRRLEIRTGPASRINDADAQHAVALLGRALAAGDLGGGVKAALDALARAAGPALAGAPASPELPDLLTG